MKKSLLLILAVLLIASSCMLALSACDKGDTTSNNGAVVSPTSTDYFEFEVNEDRASYSIVGTKDILPEDVVLPSEYKGYPVTEIGIGAFEGCTEIKSVVVPNGVEVIKASTFENCTNLKKVTLPDSVTHIYNMAFWCCYSLESVVLSQNLEFIGLGAFSHCTNLRDISLPDSLKKIEDGGFSVCGFKSITLPQNLNYVGGKAFEYCEELEIVTISGAQTQIYNNIVCLSEYGDGLFDYMILDLFQNELESYNKDVTFNTQNLVISLDLNKIDYDAWAEILIANQSGLLFEKDDIIMYLEFEINSVIQKNNSSLLTFTFDSNVFNGCVNVREIRINKNASIWNSVFAPCVDSTILYI